MSEKTETPENENNEEASQWKLPFNEIEKLYDEAVKKIGMLEDGVERVASSVFYGYHKGWNLAKTIKYYSLPKDIAKNLWSKFNFPEKGGEQTVTTRTRSKQDVIVGFLKTNVGKVITPAEVAKNVNISLPTFYNFYNANRQFFKKVQRGKFEILNPEQERQKA